MLSKILFFILASFLTHCGSSKFAGSPATPPAAKKEPQATPGSDDALLEEKTLEGDQPDEDVEDLGEEEPGVEEEDEEEPSEPERPEPTPLDVTALHLNWNCDQGFLLENEATQSFDKPGATAHSFRYSETGDIILDHNGPICEFEDLPRDIIFAIDVSGSMEISDPNDPAGGCGRREAVENLVNLINSQTTAGSARYAVITFDDHVNYQSSAFYPDLSSLYEDLLGGENPDNVLCYFFGDTSYSAPLVGADTLFQNSRSYAQKEIYFISDGAPNVAGETGELEASVLKDPGVDVGGKKIPVTIATIMLTDEDDSALRDSIASRDANGNPLHVKLENAAQLAQALEDLAANEITGARIQYRKIGSDVWEEYDLFSHASNGSFLTPTTRWSRDNAARGVEYRYSFWDSHNNLIEQSGQFTWESN